MGLVSFGYIIVGCKLLVCIGSLDLSNTVTACFIISIHYTCSSWLAFTIDMQFIKMYILVSHSPPCPQVSAHNKLVRLVNSQGKDAAFHCWLPSTPLTVDVREFSTSDALFPNHDPHKLKEQILNMIRSRSLSTIPKDPSEAISVTTMASRAMFDFDKLESDVVCYYLAGKPFISDVESTLRRPFRFRGYKLDSSTVTSG